MKKKVVIFGASGAIGTSLIDWFVDKNFFVYAVSRSPEEKNNTDSVEWLNINVDNNIVENLENKSIDSVVWAQGENLTDNIHSFNANNFRKIIESNVSYILITLHDLLNNKKLKDKAPIDQDFKTTLTQDINQDAFPQSETPNIKTNVVICNVIQTKTT